MIACSGDPLSVRIGSRPFSVYVHVPFCSVRCGYCDFNTYTATDLGGGASQRDFATTALQEVDLAARVLAERGVLNRPVSTVFFGGGTPTLLPVSDLTRLLDGVREHLSGGAFPNDVEVTTEANPDSVTRESLEQLAAAGFTRISFGMQSAVPAVLATLERTHDPARIPEVVEWARAAGLDVSLDLIYGTPGESLENWRTSLETAIATGVDHISAYALKVEPGTKMGALIHRGLLPEIDEDSQADMYEMADALLTASGLQWYEISNWARPGFECRHNLAYWRGHDWWGIGPGAHSYLAASSSGERWWNVKHPRRYASLLAVGDSPEQEREFLSPDDDAIERVMLQIRLREGLPIAELAPTGRAAVAGLVAQGLLDGAAAIGAGNSDRSDRRAVLTLKGRLLADSVVLALTV